MADSIVPPTEGAPFSHGAPPAEVRPFGWKPLRTKRLLADGPLVGPIPVPHLTPADWTHNNLLPMTRRPPAMLLLPMLACSSGTKGRTGRARG